MDILKNRFLQCRGLIPPSTSPLPWIVGVYLLIYLVTWPEKCSEFISLQFEASGVTPRRAQLWAYAQSVSLQWQWF